MDDFEFNNLNKDNNVDSHENEDYKYPENMSLSDYSDEQDDSSTKNMDNPGLIENSEKKDDKMKTFFISTIAILSILIIILISYIIYSVKNPQKNILNFSADSFNQTSENNSASNENAEVKFEEIPSDSKQLSAETIYSKLSPSVVGVVMYDSKANIISDPIGQGSGVIISENGYIVTNSHVIGNSKQYNIKVVLSNNEEYSAKIIGFDSKTDLAVIKIEKSGLTFATFGNSDEVKVGSSALALGNPLGLNFAGSLTRGIVSAVNRCTSGTANSLVKYIQTDAAINPGNSGGPLINMYGQIIGINSSKIAVEHCEGMGFAIPSNTVKSVVDDIIKKGYVSGRVRLGISGKMVTNYQSQFYNVPMGIIISEISNDSNLLAKGIQTGDIITKINNVDILNLDSFYAELYSHKPGDTITLKVYRQPSNKTISPSTFEVNVTLLEDKGETQIEKN